MDRLLTVGEAAKSLGVSAPTVRRAAVDLGIDAARTPGGHRRFTPAQAALLTSRLGVTPQVQGLGRNEVRVLAALARHPNGLRSTRALASSAGISPTSASRAAQALEHRDLAHHVDEVVAEGSARAVTTWKLVVGPAWLAVASQVAGTAPPRRSAPEVGDEVPRRFWHLFWNAEPARLRLRQDGDYLAKRMVCGEDAAARAWALRHLPASSLRRLEQGRGADPQGAAMVRNALAARP